MEGESPRSSVPELCPAASHYQTAHVGPLSLLLLDSVLSLSSRFFVLPAGDMGIHPGLCVLSAESGSFLLQDTTEGLAVAGAGTRIQGP